VFFPQQAVLQSIKMEFKFMALAVLAYLPDNYDEVLWQKS